jgi:hypothetical protein
MEHLYFLSSLVIFLFLILFISSFFFATHLFIFSFIYLFRRAVKRMDASERISVWLPVSDIYLLWYSGEIPCLPAS